MLVLGRESNKQDKDKDTIIITTPNGEVIKVILLSTNGQQASIGIEADKSVKIMRQELLMPVGDGTYFSVSES